MATKKKASSKKAPKVPPSKPPMPGRAVFAASAPADSVARGAAIKTIEGNPQKAGPAPETLTPAQVRDAALGAANEALNALNKPEVVYDVSKLPQAEQDNFYQTRKDLELLRAQFIHESLFEYRERIKANIKEIREATKDLDETVQKLKDLQQILSAVAGMIRAFVGVFG